jgi:hypothetical protein
MVREAIVLAALLGCSALPDGDTSCADCDRISQQPGVVRQPRNVLLTPLLKKYYSGEKKWMGDVAALRTATAQLDAFYRGQGVTTTLVDNVWDWHDFATRFDDIAKTGVTYDRVIFIGFGGYDGPMLTETLLDASFEPGTYRRVASWQPGVEQINLITYDVAESSEFSDFVAAHRDDLLDVQTDFVSLVEGHVQVDETCVASCVTQANQEAAACEPRCAQSPSCAGLAPDLAADCRSGCVAECQQEYVDPPASAKCPAQCQHPTSYDRKEMTVLDEAGFDNFASLVRAVTSPAGLVILGHSNAATLVDPAKGPRLVEHTFHGGPHKNYVDLLADATGRFVTGPIGQTAWQDAVERIKRLEGDQQQHYLHIAKPR